MSRKEGDSSDTHGAADARRRDDLPAFTVVRTPKALRQLTSELRDPARTQPVIGLAPDATGKQPVVAPNPLRALLDPRVRVFFLESSGMRVRLEQRLGPRLALTDGIRIWWPGAPPDSDPRDHPHVVVQANEAATLQAFAVALEKSRPTLSSLRAQLNSTAQQLTQTQRELHGARNDAKDANRAANTAKAELKQANKRLAALETAGDARLAVLADMDTEETMHLAITSEWLRTLTATDRQTHPLGPYVYGPRFLQTVHESRTVASIDRVGRACAMIACGWAARLPGLAPHPLKNVPQTGGRHHKNEREDGARGWICRLRAGAGANRLVYWTYPGGRIEFDSVRKHDEAAAP
jgi:hypothetical protein